MPSLRRASTPMGDAEGGVEGLADHRSRGRAAAQPSTVGLLVGNTTPPIICANGRFVGAAGHVTAKSAAATEGPAERIHPLTAFRLEEHGDPLEASRLGETGDSSFWAWILRPECRRQ